MPILTNWGLGVGDREDNIDSFPVLESVTVDAPMVEAHDSLDTPPISSPPLCLLSTDEGDPTCSTGHRPRRSADQIHSQHLPALPSKSPPLTSHPAWLHSELPPEESLKFRRLDLPVPAMKPERHLPRSPRTFTPTRRPSPAAMAQAKQQIAWTDVLKFGLLTTILQKVYHYALFKLPSFYLTRFTIFFEDGAMSLDNLKMAVFEHALNPSSSMTRETRKPLIDDWVAFLDSLIKGWETMSVISALLLTAIFSVIQLNNAAADPTIRFPALASMICALLSLVFGCVYTIWLGTMKELHKATELGYEVRNQNAHFWDTWVMLSMPAVWLGWSILWFITCTMLFLWRSGAAADKFSQPSQSQPFASLCQPSTSGRILVPRVLISVILALGAMYLILAAISLKRYGMSLDKTWKDRIKQWVNLYRRAIAEKAANEDEESLRQYT